MGETWRSGKNMGHEITALGWNSSSVGIKPPLPSPFFYVHYNTDFIHA